MNDSLWAAIIFLSLLSALFLFLWRRSDSLRVKEKGKMMGCYIETRAVKISQRKEEVLRYIDPNSNEPWLPKIVWQQMDDPYFVEFWVLDPVTDVPGQQKIPKDKLDIALEGKLAGFEIDFHNPLDYAVHFRGEPYFREGVNSFHALLRKYVDISTPWNIKKNKFGIHKSKSPNPAIEENKTMSVSAG